MGLIDGMLGDLIGGSTGIEGRMIRRMVRRAGVRNLLMLGGAAALGGLAVSKAGPGSTAPAWSGPGSRTEVPPSAGGGAPPTGRAVPPPPPPPAEVAAAEDSAAAVPPPPPPPAAPPSAPAPSAAPAHLRPEEDDLDIDVLPPDAVLPAVRTMVAAALADGELSGEERSMVLGRIDDADLPEESVRRIHQDLVLPPTPDELAALAPTPEARETLYRLAAVVLMADGEATATERGWLDRLAAAFEVAPERKAALEHEVFGHEG